jgi:hypothetical protein
MYTLLLGNFDINYIIYNLFEIFKIYLKLKKLKEKMKFQKYSICWNEIFKINQLFNRHLLKLLRYYGSMLNILQLNVGLPLDINGCKFIVHKTLFLWWLVRTPKKIHYNVNHLEKIPRIFGGYFIFMDIFPRKVKYIMAIL